jgi:uncharacterized protein YndB with AHSA1/START domain
MFTTLSAAAIPADDPRRKLADREIVRTDSPLDTSLRDQFQYLGLGVFGAIKWPEEMAPSRSPTHFTNELEVAASRETIWSPLVAPKAWPSFYPGVEHVHLLDGGESLRLGMGFETNLAGQDVFASVQEFEPITRIDWGGFSKVAPDSKAFHAWIITPTPQGSHLWTEETMQGPRWIELATKADDPFWRTHEKLLEALGKVAIKREGSPGEETTVR